MLNIALQVPKHFRFYKMLPVFDTEFIITLNVILV